MKAYLFIIFMISVFHLSGQELGHAVLVSELKSEDQELVNYHKAVIKHLNDRTGDHFILYERRSENSDLSKQVLFGKNEVPVSIIHYMEPYFVVSRKPTVQMQNDTSGKTTKMFFTLNHMLKYNIKSYDVATGSLLHSKEIIIGKNNGNLDIPDFAKYFGPKPAELKRSATKYKEAVSKVHDAYRKTIDNTIAQLFDKLDQFHPIQNEEFSKLQDELYLTTPGKTETAQAEPRLNIEAGSNKNITKGDLFFVYSKQIAGNGYEYYTLEQRCQVEEVESNKAAIGPLTFGARGFRKLIEQNIPLYATRNEEFAEQFNSKKIQKKTSIALESTCESCIQQAETILLKKSAVSIVDRGSAELTYFRELVKREAFINYPVDKILGKQIGADILITLDKKYVNAIDIKTNRQLASAGTRMTKREMFYNEEGFRPAHLFEIMNSYNQDMLPFEWVETIKDSKDALKTGIVYHPLGFEPQFMYQIFLINMVDVNGEQIPEKEFVAEFRAGKSLSGNLSEASIKDGGKELKKLVQEKKNLFIQLKS